MATVGAVGFAEVGDGWVGYRTIGDLSHHALLYVPTAAGGNVDVTFEYPPIRTFFDDLARSVGVILFDRRGTGVSDGMPGRIAPALEDWTDDALAVLDALGIDRVVLFAHAMGTAPALLFAAAHPDRVASLITVNGFARFIDAPGYDVGMPADVIDRVVSSVRERWGEGSVFLDVNPGLRSDPETQDWIARMERNTFGRAAAVRAWRTWLETDVRPIVMNVRSRSFVMTGTRQTIPKASHWLADTLPDAELFEFENQSFDWWYLEGQAVARAAIVEFVTGAPPDAPVDRVLTTVMFTDIVDSTARAEELGDRRWREVLDQHDGIAATVVDDHRGHLVKQTGDGILATFDGPARGVSCARRLVDALAERGIPVRAGLHAGEVEVRGDDVSGLGVHIASRVAANAQRGEVLVSRTVPDLVAGSGLSFISRGQHQLKGVSGSWELFTLAGT